MSKESPAPCKHRGSEINRNVNDMEVLFDAASAFAEAAQVAWQKSKRTEDESGLIREQWLSRARSIFIEALEKEEVGMKDSSVEEKEKRLLTFKRIYISLDDESTFLEEDKKYELQLRDVEARLRSYRASTNYSVPSINYSKGVNAESKNATNDMVDSIFSFVSESVDLLRDEVQKSCTVTEDEKEDGSNSTSENIKMYTPKLINTNFNLRANPNEIFGNFDRANTKVEENCGKDENVEKFDSAFMHRRHTCDGCGQSPIIGCRYHATNIPDFDLCESCKGSVTVSSEIKLVQVQDGVDAENEIKLAKDKKEAETEIKSTQDKVDGFKVFDPAFIHMRHTCDGCGQSPIIGYRNHATNIPNYDLCSDCKNNCNASDMKFELAQYGPDRKFQFRERNRKNFFSFKKERTKLARKCNRNQKDMIKPETMDIAHIVESHELDRAIELSLEDLKNSKNFEDVKEKILKNIDDFETHDKDELDNNPSSLKHDTIEEKEDVQKEDEATKESLSDNENYDRKKYRSPPVLMDPNDANFDVNRLIPGTNMYFDYNGLNFAPISAPNVVEPYIKEAMVGRRLNPTYQNIDKTAASSDSNNGTATSSTVNNVEVSSQFEEVEAAKIQSEVPKESIPDKDREIECQTEVSVSSPKDETLKHETIDEKEDVQIVDKAPEELSRSNENEVVSTSTHEETNAQQQESSNSQNDLEQDLNNLKNEDILDDKSFTSTNEIISFKSSSSFIYESGLDENVSAVSEDSWNMV